MSRNEAMRSISLVGDMLIHDRLAPESDGVVKLLDESDLVLANLETTLARSRTRPAAKYFNMWGKQTVLEELKRMGVAGVSLANNHAMDFDFEGLFETMEQLEAHGIAFVGAGHNIAEAAGPKILKRNGLKVAFLACSCQPSSHAIATNTRPGLAPLRLNISVNVRARDLQEWIGAMPWVTVDLDKEDTDRLLEAVQEAKTQADMVVVSIHWGLQWQPMVLDYQIQLAHSLIDKGADIIMGHGPHVLQGFETHRGKIIFYSLGHFVYDVTQPAHLDGKEKVVVDSGLRRSMNDPNRFRALETAVGRVVLEGTSIKQAEMIPVMLDQNGNPLMSDDKTALSILNYLSVISRYLGTDVVIENNRGILRT